MRRNGVSDPPGERKEHHHDQPAKGKQQAGIGRAIVLDRLNKDRNEIAGCEKSSAEYETRQHDECELPVLE